MNKAKPKVVVIGGGTGTSVVLTGLKEYPLEITSIVTVADSGGSTGRLRDEFGFAPVGDLRQAIAALSKDTGSSLLREVMLYRFTKGSGFKGHNLGNLILTALQDMTESTAQAVEIASKIFRVQGHIYPITSRNIQLVIEYQDGTVEIGEHILDEAKHGGKKIVNLKTSPRARIYKKSRDAIVNADYIIIGPGDVFGSLLPNFVIEGVTQAVAQSSAQLIYVLNLMTRYSQTHNLTARQHLELIEQYLKKPVDKIICNSSPIPVKIKRRYAKDHEYPLINDLPDDPDKIMRAPLIRTALVKPQKGDRLTRSYLRHHPQKLAQEIIKIITQ
jgi:uncharacterized cofD-like protein